MASKGNDLETLLEQKSDIEQKLASLERQIYPLTCFLFEISIFHLCALVTNLFIQISNIG